MIDCPKCGGSGMEVLTGRASRPRAYTLHVGVICSQCRGTGRWFSVDEVKSKAIELGGERWPEFIEIAVEMLTKETTQ